MEIIFAGGSHYSNGGYQSLTPYFDKIYILKNSLEFEKREQDVYINDFEDIDCKIVFLCGYAALIEEALIEKKIFINVHGALLPQYRGMHSTFYAIMNDEKKLGITFHLVNKYIDAGAILASYEFEYNGQTVEKINEEIDFLVQKYAGEVIKKYVCGEIIPVQQDEMKMTVGARRNLDDCYVDFNMSNELLRRFFKALTPPYPAPMIKVKNRRYEIIGEYKIVDRQYWGPFARAVFLNEAGIWIKNKDGFLVVKTLRDYETKDEVEAESIIPLGYRFGERQNGEER